MISQFGCPASFLFMDNQVDAFFRLIRSSVQDTFKGWVSFPASAGINQIKLERNFSMMLCLTAKHENRPLATHFQGNPVAPL